MPLSVPSIDAVLLVDMQPGFVKHLFPDEEETLLRNKKRLLVECSRFDVLVISLLYKKYGKLITELRGAYNSVSRRINLVKPEDDGFSNPSLKSHLDNFNTKTVLLTGLNASYCVLDTAERAVK